MVSPSLAPGGECSTAATMSDQVYDPQRLKRAIDLKWDRRAPGVYAILGSKGDRYEVNLNDPPYCTCPDMLHRNAAGTGWCKHAIKAAAVEAWWGFRGPYADEVLARELRRQRASGDEDEESDDA